MSPTRDAVGAGPFKFVRHNGNISVLDATDAFFRGRPGLAGAGPRAAAVFYSKAGPRGGLINGCQDPEIDAALDAENNETGPVQRKALLGKATELIAGKAPSLSLFTSVLLHGKRAGLEDLVIYPNGPLDASRARFTSA